MSAGDILLYTSDGTLPDRVITALTGGGPYVHAEIDAGDGTAIGALASGVARHPLRAPAARITVPGLVELVSGLAWLAEQVTAHDEYGWADLADALPHLPLSLTDPDGYDCSHLCAAFVLHAGGAAWLGVFADDPARVSPNDLARLGGVLASSPSRGGAS